MNWNRDKNSSEEKAVNRETVLHVGLGVEILTINWNRDKNSWEEKAVNGENDCMVGFGGNLNNRDKNSSEEKAVNRELNTITIACWA